MSYQIHAGVFDTHPDRVWHHFAVAGVVVGHNAEWRQQLLGNLQRHELRLSGGPEMAVLHKLTLAGHLAKANSRITQIPVGFTVIWSYSILGYAMLAVLSTLGYSTAACLAHSVLVRLEAAQKLTPPVLHLVSLTRNVMSGWIFLFRMNLTFSCSPTDVWASLLSVTAATTTKTSDVDNGRHHHHHHHGNHAPHQCECSSCFHCCTDEPPWSLSPGWVCSCHSSSPAIQCTKLLTARGHWPWPWSFREV